MTFKRARKELAKIANGRYHSLRYEETKHSEYGGGEIRQDVSVYIDGMDYYKGNTWEEAFAALNKAINPPQFDETAAPE
jgi:hypothetical protein